MTVDSIVVVPALVTVPEIVAVLAVSLAVFSVVLEDSQYND